MQVLYLVPDLPFSPKDAFKDAFFDALDALSGRAIDFVENGRTETATQIETRFSDDEETTHVTVIEDHVPKVRYLELASEGGPDAIEAVREALCAHMAIIDHDALVGEALAQGISDPMSYYTIAYSASPEPRSATIELVAKGLASSDPAVREHAANAAGLIGWPELLDVLHACERKEEPGLVKRAMQDALRTYGVTF